MAVFPRILVDNIKEKLLTQIPTTEQEPTEKLLSALKVSDQTPGASYKGSIKKSAMVPNAQRETDCIKAP